MNSKLLFIGLIFSVMLTGCQYGGKKITFKDIFYRAESTAALFVHSHEKALREYEQGQIMEAKETILSMDQSRSDYPLARMLLERKVEPARKRLLKYYINRGQGAKENRQWAVAHRYYTQASYFSPDDIDLALQAQDLRLKVRQVRFNSLLFLQRKEDDAILSWLDAYEPPSGLDVTDPFFIKKKEDLEDWASGLAKDKLRSAKREIRKNNDELAFIEIESYLRFRPQDIEGAKMMATVKERLPMGIAVPSYALFADVESAEKKAMSDAIQVVTENRKEMSEANPAISMPISMNDAVKEKSPRISTAVKKNRKKKVVRVTPIPALVSPNEIEKQIRDGNWIEARKKALLYARQGGDGAESYIRTIVRRVESEAEVAFQKGSIAFRKEHLDEAVQNWQLAAQLRPENSEYVGQYRRALQMQERLKVLRLEIDN